MIRRLACLAILVAGPLFAQSSWTASGDSLFALEKYDAALKAFRSGLQENPKDGYAAVRAGHSLQALGDYKQALKLYDEAEQLGYWPVAVLYRKARVHALLKNSDSAFEWLGKMVSAGFGNVAMLKSEKDLDFVRDDKRFGSILAKADSNARPCMYLPEARQFDFWIGEWDVYTPKGQLAGSNVIQSVEDGCLLIENWTGGFGTGKSINFYDKNVGKWRQVWVSSTGNVSDFAGNYDDQEKVLKLYGESHPQNGQKIMRKLFFYNLEPGKVRQYSEQSTDGGKTWTVAYDFTYIRKQKSDVN